MNKQQLLQKLQRLQVKSISEFKEQSDIVNCANKIAPILERVNSDYYANFMGQAPKFNLQLSPYTLEPAFNIMHSQVEMAIEELKLDVEAESELQNQYYFPVTC